MTDQPNTVSAQLVSPEGDNVPISVHATSPSVGAIPVSIEPAEPLIQSARAVFQRLYTDFHDLEALLEDTIRENSALKQQLAHYQGVPAPQSITQTLRAPEIPDKSKKSVPRTDRHKTQKDTSMRERERMGTLVAKGKALMAHAVGGLFGKGTQPADPEDYRNTVWQPIGRYSGHRDGVWEVSTCPTSAFTWAEDSPPFDVCNTIFATASADRTARIWLGPLVAYQHIPGAADHASVVSSWETNKDRNRDLVGSCVAIYTGHRGSVNSIRFHRRQTRFVITSSGDTSAHLWKIPTLTTIESQINDDDVVEQKPGPWRPLLTTSDMASPATELPKPAEPDDDKEQMMLEEEENDDGEVVPEKDSPVTESKESEPVSPPVAPPKKVAPGRQSISSVPCVPIRSPLVEMNDHDDVVSAAEWLASGEQVATASFDTTVKIWQAETGRLVTTLTGHDSALTNIDCHPSNDEMIISAGKDAFKLWDVRTANPVDACIGHTGPVSSACFAENGNTIVSGGDDHSIRIWDIRSLKNAVQTMVSSSGVNRLSVSAQHGYIAAPFDDANVRVYDRRVGVRRVARIAPSRSGHRKIVCSAAWSPDETMLFSSGFDPKQVVVYGPFVQ